MQIGDFIWADHPNDHYYYPSTIMAINQGSYTVELHKGGKLTLALNELWEHHEGDHIPIEYQHTDEWLPATLKSLVGKKAFIEINGTDLTVSTAKIRTSHFPSTHPKI
jgi:hypothetical protein